MNTPTIEGFIEERLDQGHVITPELFDFAAAQIDARSYYKRHELAIWSVIVVAGITAFYLLFRDNSELMWDLSTPVMEYLP